MGALNKVSEKSGVLIYGSESKSVGYLMEWTETEKEAPPSLTFPEACFSHQGYMIFVTDSFEQLDAKSVEVLTFLKNQLNMDQGYVWISDLEKLSTETVTWFVANQHTGDIQRNAVVPIGYEWNLSVSAGVEIRLDYAEEPEQAELVFHSGPISFTGESSLQSSTIQQIRIPLVGEWSGCVLIDNLSIRAESLILDLGVGFRFVSPNVSSDTGHQFVHYPLVAYDQNTDVLMHACIDPISALSPTDDRGFVEPKIKTFFAVSKMNAKGFTQQLKSYLVTTNGEPIWLEPSDSDTMFAEHQPRFVFHSGPDKEPFLSPAGDFQLSLKNNSSSDTPVELVCGLSGLEYLIVPQGGSLRFKPFMPAYAFHYDPTETDSHDDSTLKQENLLVADFTTSWLSIAPVEGEIDTSNQYVSQPTGSVLYGNSSTENQEMNLLNYKPTPVLLGNHNDHAFPLVPYGGMNFEQHENSKEELLRFEQHILSPARRYFLSTLLIRNDAENPPPEEYQATTPNGLLIRLNGSRFEKVLLTKSKDTEFCFERPDEHLQQALQTNQLFLVATTDVHLGKPKDQAGEGPVFNNIIDIGGWKFDINVDNSTLDDVGYQNILIMKSRVGPGQTLSELVKQPKTWTQPQHFIQSTYEGVDVTESGDIPALSQWLNEYFIDAAAEEAVDSTLSHFNQIVHDPNWTGVIILRPTIKAFPDEISNLKNLIVSNNNTPDPQIKVYGHHIGFETMVSEGLIPALESRIFGLIRYQDDKYNPSTPQTPVQLDEECDFRLLHLRLVIRESKIKDFSCKGQLTMKNWFTQNVLGTGERDMPSSGRAHAILLEGYQQRVKGKGEHPICVLESTGPVTFYMREKGSVLKNVTVEKVTYESVDQEARLSVSGNIGFNQIKLRGGSPFDLWTFGKDGLQFSQLIIQKRDQAWNVNLEQASFKPTAPVESHEDRSLFDSLSMELIGFLPNKQGSISDLGFIRVTTTSDFFDVGLDERLWNGLKFRLQAGTAGKLSDNKLLEAELLLAWGAGKDNQPDRYETTVGLKLGGSKPQFQIQNVLSLQFEDLVLNYIHEHKRFELTLSDAYIRFLGLRLPPTGSMALKWFGSGEQNQPIGWFAKYQ
ncbi:hypothetical protein SAMN05428987_4891 [Paenibacillus sp. CF095]|uniref:hypothetical protein n=1 Tax=Paenibacillus sp. CF095 TaxID=1881033 RepID=UPI0008825DDE|nr:hypothetical protein [Paenibacillus sp. CF095]SDD47674.1 hypothetical protein SAMN05428987_4891 [Paenibacillus sp. CF095]